MNVDHRNLGLKRSLGEHGAVFGSWPSCLQPWRPLREASLGRAVSFSQLKMQYITKFCAGQVETIVLVFCVHDVSQQYPVLNFLFPGLGAPHATYYFSDIPFSFMGQK